MVKHKVACEIRLCENIKEEKIKEKIDTAKKMSLFEKRGNFLHFEKLNSSCSLSTKSTFFIYELCCGNMVTTLYMRSYAQIELTV